ncbi:uncharacterized protein Ecym_2063 [Eremothecium cymbalariae DBVPG|uniref:Uncharacterized protein n=1 Tax=Eremothecium cymbalariae (strain CBS 270.75 / DBVPG 7215 / KCTC 17166 / NRRL Y-17582) TaxID=931890 RepID=G8JP20_ERECY|nr:Hypothetical protein Ecym_2063 [Eremothecium cymbalariae DBVPG\
MTDAEASTLGYVQHVSFQDLSPAVVDEQVSKMKKCQQSTEFSSALMHIPPQYNPFYVDPSLTRGGRCSVHSSGTATKGPKNPSLKPDLWYSSQSQQEVMEAYKFMYEENMVGSSRRKSIYVSPRSSRSNSLTRTAPSGVKMPPPPKVSILKKCETDQQVKDFDITKIDPKVEKEITKLTEQNTENNAEARDGYTTSGFSNLHELEDNIMGGGTLDAKAVCTARKDMPKVRRKSYAEMSNAELAKLEESFLPRPAYGDLDKFDFSQQNKLFIGQETSKNVQRQKTEVNSPAILYPSRPCVSYRAVSCTMAHPAYRTYVSDRCGSSTHETLRTVACHISGRQHTWSAVDWYVHRLAQNGDHLVILASLPRYEEHVVMPPQVGKSRKLSFEVYKFEQEKRPSVNSQTPCSNINNVNELEKVGLTILELDNLAKEKCISVLKYYAGLCRDKILRITVEFIKEDSRMCSIAQATSLYKPELQVISTVSANINTKFRNGHVRLPNFMIRHFSVPTIVVPNEFIRLGDVSSHKPLSDNKSAGVQLDKLDSVVARTSKNPFDLMDADGDSNESGKYSDISSKSTPQSDNDSVAGYFPIDPELQRKREQFKSLGYIPPRPSYYGTHQDLSNTSSRSSRRPSRVNFSTSDIYKVKSMISDDVSTDSAVIRNSKSAQLSNRAGAGNNSSSISSSISKKSASVVLSRDCSSKSEGFSQKTGKKKKGLGSLFKKLKFK